MDIKRLRELVGDGKIFGVKFIKKDGSERVMGCRTGVFKYTKGGEIGYDREAKNLLGVYEMPNKGYKSIPADRIISVTAKGRTYDK